MSDSDTHGSVDSHATDAGTTPATPAPGHDDHGAADGLDDHGHGSAALGPIDVQAWGALVVGAGMGLVVAVCVALSTGAL